MGGGFKKEKRHGDGKGSTAEGEECVGGWRLDMWDGHGVWLMVDGGRYEGDFKDHKRNGQGSLRHADGSVYSGVWKDDLYDGDGQWMEKYARVTPMTYGPRVKDVLLGHRCLGS